MNDNARPYPSMDERNNRMTFLATLGGAVVSGWHRLTAEEQETILMATSVIYLGECEPSLVAAVIADLRQRMPR